MAYPTVRDSQTSILNSGNVNHSITYPTTVVAGDILIGIFGAKEDSVTPFDSEWAPGDGWTELAEDEIGVVGLSIAWKEADGSEGGNTTLVTSNALITPTHAAIIYAVKDASIVSNPESLLDKALSTNAPDSPSLTPTGGSKDYLFISAFVYEMTELGSIAVSSYPSGYASNQVNAQSGTDSWSTGIAAATQNITSTADNPGVAALSADSDWVAATIAVHPVVAASSDVSDFTIGFSVACTATNFATGFTFTKTGPEVATVIDAGIQTETSVIGTATNAVLFNVTFPTGFDPATETFTYAYDATVGNIVESVNSVPLATFTATAGVVCP